MAADKKSKSPDVVEENAAAERTRVVSTIEFPYGDLDDAISVVSAIHDNAGTSCDTDQLAAYMKHPISSGTFRQKVSSARIFGLVETTRGSVSLAELGRKIVDPTYEKKARVEAFLTVPLYKAIFENYKGHLLPPLAALEREIGKLGVSAKQVGRARQSLERSAEQAGFTAHGKDKLVMPSGANQQETKKLEPTTKKIDEPHVGASSENNGGDWPPFIQGLLGKLPKGGEGSLWSMSDRAKWLQTASNIFDLMYVTEEQDSLSIISIKVDKL